MGAVLAAIERLVAMPTTPQDGSTFATTAVAALTACIALAFVYANHYDGDVAGGARGFVARLAPPLIVAGAAFAIALHGAPGRRFSMVLAGLGAALVLVGPMRALSHRIDGRRLTRRVLIVGTSPVARELIDELRSRGDGRFGLSVVTEDGTDVDVADLACPIAGSVRELSAILGRVRPDVIVVALGERRGRSIMRVLLESRACGLAVHDGAELYERLTGKIAIDTVAPSSLVFANGFWRSSTRRAVRRAAGTAVAAAGLIVLAPLLIVIAIAIALDSPGPVLFTQERIGCANRCFRLVKFRTMRPVSHVPSEWAADNLDRITTVGRWLRRFRLDELPQLVNVLRGEMELVGPRPHPVSNRELFAREIPYYWLRASIAPGITGWAQIRFGYANDLDGEIEKMRYDLYYIKHQSLWLDFRIAVGTLKAVVMGPSRDRAGRYRRAVGRRMAARESGAA
jgi:exopolysaccharide biosynthesis polyprenyl glycosylphosphotransferase